MALSQNQTLRQTQRIEQSQLMLTRLLDVSDMELEELIAKEVEDNPVLEIEHDETPEKSIDELSHDKEQSPEQQSDDFVDDWEPNISERFPTSTPGERYEKPIVETSYFRDELLQQLGELELDDRSRAIAGYIIGNLEDNGYLKQECLSVSNDLIVQYGLRTSAAEVEKVLTEVVQTLEPAGIGARNLKECLLLQLHALQDQKPSHLLVVATKVVQDYFDEFIHKKFDKICRKERFNNELWDEIQQIITKLNPNPVQGVDASAYVTPDFIIAIENEELKLSLANESLPKLRINAEYEEMLAAMRAQRNREAIQFIQKNIEKARLFIATLPERERTMYLVMSEIMKQQHDFFISGDPKSLKPMVLRDVASKVGMDESTVSRVTTRRYVQTPYGTYSLKDLFSEAVNDTDGVSSKAVKQCLKELVETEDKTAPYTDDALVELLKQQKFNVSRRTVAKYRAQLHIPSRALRRE